MSKSKGRYLLRKTKDHLEGLGYSHWWIVERTTRMRTEDLWTIADAVCFGPCGRMHLVQVTTSGHKAAHVRKICAAPAYNAIRNAGLPILLVTWNKRKNGTWHPSKVEL